MAQHIVIADRMWRRFDYVAEIGPWTNNQWEADPWKVTTSEGCEGIEHVVVSA